MTAEREAQQFHLVVGFGNSGKLKFRKFKIAMWRFEKYRLPASFCGMIQFEIRFPEQVMFIVTGKTEGIDLQQQAQLLDRDGDAIYEIIQRLKFPKKIAGFREYA